MNVLESCFLQRYVVAACAAASFLVAGPVQAQAPITITISDFTETVIPSVFGTGACPVLEGVLSPARITVKIGGNTLFDNFVPFPIVDCILPTATGAAGNQNASFVAGSTFVFSSSQPVNLGLFSLKYQGTLKVIDTEGHAVLHGGFSIGSPDGSARIGGGGSLSGTETIDLTTSKGTGGPITLTGVITGL